MLYVKPPPPFLKYNFWIFYEMAWLIFLVYHIETGNFTWERLLHFRCGKPQRFVLSVEQTKLIIWTLYCFSCTEYYDIKTYAMTSHICCLVPAIIDITFCYTLCLLWHTAVCRGPHNLSKFIISYYVKARSKCTTQTLHVFLKN